jgi:F420-dependent oxidoreductase-like protein
MRFSVWPSPDETWDEILELARHAEATGWDGIWFADHFMPNTPEAEGPVMECWSVLAGLAAAVPRLRLGALVTGNTYRHPAVLAKIAATVDQMSGGRVVLGLGAGWQENEHRAYGIDFSDVRGRLERLDEACQIIRGLTSQPRTTFAGKHYQLQDAPLDPKPVGDSVRLLVGGGGEKVTLRIAAAYADEWNVWGEPEVLRQKGEVLDRHCEALGRDPASIERSAQAILYLSDDESWLATQRERSFGRPVMIGTPAQLQDIVGAYRDAGVDEIIVPDWNLRSRRAEVLDRFQAEVASAFRS